jgi:sec-independent protein translocase protein TatB
VFGVSFPELVVLGTVALLVLGPEKLPGMLRTMGQWIAKVRRLTTEVRYQSGIDEVLRAEGFDGGLNELRSMMRGGGHVQHPAPARPVQPDPFVPDRSREYPVEGPDAQGALPEDLLSPATAEVSPVVAPALPAPGVPAQPSDAAVTASTAAAPGPEAGVASPGAASAAAPAAPAPTPDAEPAGVSRLPSDSPPAEPNG